jgi:SAM-dependent methyltransferase
VAARLRAGGTASDDEFDQVYDDWCRWLSPCYWTPVEVARRAAQLLTAGGRRRVLDVGSGVGKFCIVGALTTKAQFIGVEQRPPLVTAAHNAAVSFGARGARFVDGDFETVDFGTFDAFYLFNPFEEHIAGVVPIDNTVELSPLRFRYYVVALVRKLEEARPGTRVLTYFGHGGPDLPGYRLLGKEKAGDDVLVLWERK